MSEVQKINFDEIIPDAEVRCTVIVGIQYLSIRDIIMVMCKKNGNQSNEIWRRIPVLYKEEIKALCVNLKFKGPGQKDQPVIQFQGALKLMMWLPGEQAKKFRSKAAEILTRYYAGDKTLLNDVWVNAQSDDAINVAARNALPELEEFNAKRQKMMEALKEDVEVLKIATSNTKEYSVCLNEQADIKKGMFGDEISFIEKKNSLHKEELLLQKDGLSIQKESEKIADNGRKSELEHKKAMKALDEPPLAMLGGNDFTTILKVYMKNKLQFSQINTQAKRNKLLREAGMKAAGAFIERFGCNPQKVSEDGLKVWKYPLEEEELLMESLRSTLRDMNAGCDQAPIRGFLVYTSPATTSI